MNEGFFLSKTIEKQNRRYLLTLSRMRDEDYAVKYIILHLDEAFCIIKIQFTSSDGRVTLQKDQGVVRVERWEDSFTEIPNDLQPSKDYPMPLLRLVDAHNDGNTASFIIHDAMESVEDEELRNTIFKMIDAPEEQYCVDVKSIEGLVFT